MSLQTATTGGNCGRLLSLVKMVDRQLAKAVTGKGVSDDLDVTRSLRNLADLLVRAGRLIQAYSQRGFMHRFLRSGSDLATFKSLDERIRSNMQVRAGGPCWLRGMSTSGPTCWCVLGGLVGCVG